MLPVVCYLQCREGTCGVLCVPFIVDIGAPLTTQMVVNTPSCNSIGEGIYLHMYNSIGEGNIPTYVQQYRGG